MFELSVEASLCALGDVRSFIKRSTKDLGVDDTTVADMCLVVDEAVTNIIQHGYAGREGRIAILVEGDGQDLVIRILDQAPPFDAGHVEKPHLKENLSERKFGGMGVYLIRQLTDESVFTPLPESGNELRLVKRGALRN